MVPAQVGRIKVHQQHQFTLSTAIPLASPVRLAHDSISILNTGHTSKYRRSAEEKTRSRQYQAAPASQCLGSQKEDSHLHASHSPTMPSLTSGIAHDLPPITRLWSSPQYCTLQPRRDHPACIADVLLSRPLPTCSASLRAEHTLGWHITKQRTLRRTILAPNELWQAMLCFSHVEMSHLSHKDTVRKRHCYWP